MIELQDGVQSEKDPVKLSEERERLRIVSVRYGGLHSEARSLEREISSLRLKIAHPKRILDYRLKFVALALGAAGLLVAAGCEAARLISPPCAHTNTVQQTR